MRKMWLTTLKFNQFPCNLCSKHLRSALERTCCSSSMTWQWHCHTGSNLYRRKQSGIFICSDQSKSKQISWLCYVFMPIIPLICAYYPNGRYTHHSSIVELVTCALQNKSPELQACSGLNNVSQWKNGGCHHEITQFNTKHPLVTIYR